MGGSLILFCLAVSTLLWCDLRNPFVWLALSVTVGFGAVGFADDYIKVAKRDKKGLNARLRLLLEFGIAGGAMAYLFFSDAMAPDVRLHVQLPFTNYYESGFELPAWLYVVFGTVVVVGTANAVNFTDGLDGLAIGPSIMNAGTFLVFAYIAGVQTTLAVNGHEVTIAQYLYVAHIAGVEELASSAPRCSEPASASLVQRVSRAGVHGRCRLAVARRRDRHARGADQERARAARGRRAVRRRGAELDHPTGAYKATKKTDADGKTSGKRVFLMAPIHHHYEKKGWDEPKIIVRFWLVTRCSR